MRNYKGYPGDTAWTRTAIVLLALSAGSPSCLVKHTVRVAVPQKLLTARTATLEDLLNVLSSYSDRVLSLSSGTMKVTFTSGKMESGALQAYRSAPGYILLKRPDSIRLNVQNPITKTTLIELESVGDSFGLWYPRDNKFFSGKNSAREFEVEGHPGFTARAPHIFDAILPQRITFTSPGQYVSMEEDQDNVTKYYVLSVFNEENRRVLKPVRRLWIDRSDFTVARQRVYDTEGRIVSLIQYGRLLPLDGLLLPLSIKIDRPLDGYSLDLEFANWRLNPDLPDKDFAPAPPHGAQVVELREKGRSDKP